MEVLVPVSLGELYDKFIILKIKENKIKDPNKLENIKKEIDYLIPIVQKYPIDETYFYNDLYNNLYKINSLIWDIEDKIRLKEKNKEFDEEFIELARSVYLNNDERSNIKRKINKIMGSTLIEEKSYEDYN